MEKLAQEVLSEAIQDLKDPRVGFATVTGVKLSRDLRVAEVYVSTLGSPDEQRRTMEAIKHATPHLRSVLGQQIRMRRLPEVRIVEDRTAEDSERMELLLRGLGVSQPPGEGETSEPDDEDEDGRD